MADLTVATTILKQLGGRRFLVMTGAKNCIGSADSLSFQLPGTPGYVRHGITGVRIVLTPMDTYTVEFYRVRKGTRTIVETLEDVYADMLQDVFTRVTGLHTHL